MLTLVGGILGTLMMVPLRRALIVKEHGVLPYPEGTACAEVLVAGERGGKTRVPRLQRPRGRRAVEGAVVDLQPVQDRYRLLHGTNESVPERHPQRRHFTRIPWRRVCHRPAYRGHDVRGRRAVVARAAAAADHPRARTSPFRFRPFIRTSRTTPRPGCRSSSRKWRLASCGAPTSDTSAPERCWPPA